MDHPNSVFPSSKKACPNKDFFDEPDPATRSDRPDLE
jgi:hypothetical protein